MLHGSGRCMEVDCGDHVQTKQTRDPESTRAFGRWDFVAQVGSLSL